MFLYFSLKCSTNQVAYIKLVCDSERNFKAIHHTRYAASWMWTHSFISAWSDCITLVLLLNFHFPSLHAAVANNRWPEPGPRPPTERPAAHRVSLSELNKYLLEHFCGWCNNILFYLCVCVQAWGWHGAFLGCIRSLSVSHVQAEHSRSVPHGRRPQRQHEPRHWWRVATVQKGVCVCL